MSLSAKSRGNSDRYSRSISIIMVSVFLTAGNLFGQMPTDRPEALMGSMRITAMDSLLADLCPEITLPAHLRDRVLPPAVDNSQTIFWPGIHDQYWFYTCQQFSGATYTFGYEINRMRGLDGSDPANLFSAHYTWNFMNNAEQFQGVGFFQTWDVIRRMGHPTSLDFPADTSMMQYGWASGYEKYYNGMFHRLKSVRSIRVNSEEGINTLRNFLYDRLMEGTPGGVAAMTICSNGLYNLPALPPGTPEEGKPVVIFWPSDPVHGLVIVGYNDSIRYDLNGDGKYTIDLDINNDQLVDIRDREIGGFRFANSYGAWWQDQGYAWVLYRAMGSNFEEGGVWNNHVYVVDPDPGYQPALTVRGTIQHPDRSMIRIFAGVSGDTLQQMPANTLSFPIFNFQGSNHPMQGFDTLAGGDTLEFGLDLTPLLQYITPGEKSRFFIGVEERDPDGSSVGYIRNVVFYNHLSGGESFPGTPAASVLRNNGITLISSTGTVTFDPVQITTTALPSIQPGQPYEAHLQATGGRTPYQWSIAPDYLSREQAGGFQSITGSPLTPSGDYSLYTPVVLPFSFPFYGKNYDTIYVNRYGFITFAPLALPLPYTTDDESMLKQFPSICPAFSSRFSAFTTATSGSWALLSADSAVIRWNCEVFKQESRSDNNFEVVLLPDGTIRFHYGNVENQGYDLSVIRGISSGDGQTHDLAIAWDFDAFSGTSRSYSPSGLPDGLSVDPDGILTFQNADTTQIYAIPVRVTDANGLSQVKSFRLSAGILLETEIVTADENRLVFGETAWINVKLTNMTFSAWSNLQLRLSSPDAGILITDTLEEMALLAAGQNTTLVHAFEMQLQSQFPEGYPFRFHLELVSEGHRREYDFIQEVSAVDLAFRPVEVADGDNGILERGEVSDLLFRIVNQGSVTGRDMSISLSCTDTLITMLSDSLFTGQTIHPLTESVYSFRVRASREAQWGQAVSLMLKVTGEQGYTFSLPLTLNLGNKPLAILNLTTVSPSCEAMQQCLDSLGVPYDVLTEVPPDPAYGSLFIILGTGNQTAHRLTSEEGGHLAAYLQKGGNIYMEGYSTWYYQDDTPVHPLFKYTAEKVPAYLYPMIYGVSGTITGSMVFRNTASVNYAIFGLYPRGGSKVIMTNGNAEEMNLQIAYDGADYRTIASLPEFGALADSTGISTQYELMKRYLEFFKINLTGPWVYFHASNPNICQGSTVTFYDDSFDEIQSRHWEFPGGDPASSSDAEPVVRYTNPGLYDVTLTVNDGVHNRTLTKNGFILAYNCTGMTGNEPPAGLIIFPNPASDRLIIRSEQPVRGPVNLRLLDYTGKVVLTRTLFNLEESGEISLQSIHPGIYFLTVQWNENLQVLRVIVQD